MVGTFTACTVSRHCPCTYFANSTRIPRTIVAFLFCNCRYYSPSRGRPLYSRLFVFEGPLCGPGKCRARVLQVRHRCSWLPHANHTSSTPLHRRRSCKRSVALVLSMDTLIAAGLPRGNHLWLGLLILSTGYASPTRSRRLEVGLQLRAQATSTHVGPRRTQGEDVYSMIKRLQHTRDPQRV